nr:uncharacterized protein LOC104101583 [Nicotiana tomentosiformis]
MRKRLFSSVAPPPSPIPTGRGSRSAVNSILGEYIDQSIHVPHLTLPKNTYRWVLDEIHYPSLLLRENDVMNRLLSSAAEFGVVRIIGRGISGEELRTMLTENEWLFGLSSEKYANYDKFVWDWSDNTMEQMAKVAMGEQNFLFFRNDERQREPDCSYGNCQRIDKMNTTGTSTGRKTRKIFRD